ASRRPIVAPCVHRTSSERISSHGCVSAWAVGLSSRLRLVWPASVATVWVRTRIRPLNDPRAWSSTTPLNTCRLVQADAAWSTVDLTGIGLDDRHPGGRPDLDQRARVRGRRRDAGNREVHDVDRRIDDGVRSDSEHGGVVTRNTVERLEPIEPRARGTRPYCG